MAVSGIPCGPVAHALPHPATGRAAGGRGPAEGPATTSGPHDSNGDPDDTGYSDDPVAPRRIDLTA